MHNHRETRETFTREGRVWIRGALDDACLGRLRQLSMLEARPGARISMTDPLNAEIRNAAFSQTIARLWPRMRPVRVVSFDKTAKANRGVPWHQDRVIEMPERVEAEGFSNWSQKAGVWHCEPTETVLNQMHLVRVHLDANTVENGAMEIALGSHASGKVPPNRATEIAARYATECTIAEAGDVLVMAMLTLHRSRPSEGNGNRRVLRVDYAPFDLESVEA